MKFSDEQREAIESKEAFLFLQACAGSGKTRVIVERVKRLISMGVSREDILCITFTKKASIEMAQRLNNQFDHVYTFHQYCLTMMKAYKTYPFHMIDPDDLVFSPYELLEITTYKNTLYRTKKPNSFKRYQMYLYDNNLKDFDDLLIDYLKSHIHKAYQYIFIDEFQDTNTLQYEVLKKLIKNQTKVFAVGDPNQSIYRFRGSNYRIIHQYVKDFQAKILTLSYNYRSSANIILIVNHLIKHNPKRDYLQMIPTHENGLEVESFVFNHQNDETKFVIRILKTYNHLNEIKSVAVLFRNHERAFHLKNVLYQMDDYQFVINETIHFLTIHQSKGLEFDLVVMIGLEQGELPAVKDNQEIALEEERRLCFVGMTRAKKKLILTHIKTSDFKTFYTPSVFLNESHVKTHEYMPIK